MSTRKVKSPKRTQVKDLPARNKKLSAKDMKKVKGGVIVKSDGTNFKYKPPAGG